MLPNGPAAPPIPPLKAPRAIVLKSNPSPLINDVNAELPAPTMAPPIIDEAPAKAVPAVKDVPIAPPSGPATKVKAIGKAIFKASLRPLYSFKPVLGFTVP